MKSEKIIITDIEWEIFVNENIVSEEILEIIAIRIISKCQMTKREISIYTQFNEDIENIISKYTN